MSKPTTPVSRKRTANSAISCERAACRIAVSSVPIRIGRPAAAACSAPSAKPASTASTTCSSVSPRARCCSGAKRTSAYTTPSSARSSAHSAATRRNAGSVCMTATVCSNVAMYRSSEPESQADTNQLASSPASVAGRGWPTSAASSMIVAGRSPPSRWSCNRAFGALTMSSYAIATMGKIMDADVLAYLRCPVCGEPLGAAPGVLRCPRGHSFDVARQGYVNLSTGRSPHAGDSAEMVTARAEFLDAGHYDFISVALAAAARAGYHGGLVLDAGAGTGRHLAAVLDALPAAPGLALDVSKPALRRAARA